MRQPAIALVLVIAALSAGPTAAALEPVAIGVNPSVSAGATYIALDKGYFREAGLDVDVQIIESTSTSMALLATNRVQVIEGGIAAGYWNALAQRLPVVLAFERGSTPLYHELMLSPARKDTIKTPADLKGRTIGLSGPGSVSYYEVAKVLQSAGLTFKDVEIKNIPYPQTGAALGSNAVDAALEIPPFGDDAVAHGLAVRWIDTDDYIKPQPVDVLAHFANTDWIAQNRKVADAFFAALLRGVRDYCQAYHRGPNRAEVEAIFLKHKLARDHQMLDSMAWSSRDPNGRFNLASLLDIQDWLAKEGTITATFPAERLVDASFAQSASARLPPFALANPDSKLAGCR
ncbi:MAG TPA: ABC transporter substrate-binding protein [Alphaproteobacteria bacterium]|nr:ABC transporter substrate-binding protein [Alphaproteobacteria bacterium]